MPPPRSPTRWQRRKEARPQELTAAALALFVEKGFAATRLEEVAARAGVSKGTLYLYFDSKEELFKAVVREGLVPLLAAGESMIAQSTLPAEELFQAIVLRWWELVGSTPLGGLPKLVFSEARNFPELARFYADEVIERAKRLLAQALQRGVASGEFRSFDAEELVLVVFSPLMMRLVWKHSLGCCGVPSPPDDVFLREYIELMLRGLRADPKPASRTSRNQSGSPGGTAGGKEPTKPSTNKGRNPLFIPRQELEGKPPCKSPQFISSAQFFSGNVKTSALSDLSGDLE